ncbi:MAG: hypothetical protein AAB739_00665 [Patescibacteria group bacterium]
MKKYFIAAIVSIIYIPLITIAAELYAPLKDFLKSVFWHHWLGKSVILIILFIAVAFISGASLAKYEEDNNKDGKFLIGTLWLATFSALTVVLFFMIEYMK